jgi:hypothetical protein
MSFDRRILAWDFAGFSSGDGRVLLDWVWG